MSKKPSVIFTENEIEYRVISTEFESTLDSKELEIKNFIKDNNGKGKSDTEKDILYGESQKIWSEYTSYLKSTKYNLNLNKVQLDFLTNLITNDLEYDVNTVFFAIELTESLKNMTNEKFSNDTDSIIFPVSATEITYIYHLISGHKVKGLNQNTYTFTEILRRIGDISKVFNYYDVVGKDLAADVQDWVACFEEGVSMEPRKQLEIDFEEVK
jgi:uncharacterized protein YjaG (DUF416 family)